LAVLTSGLFNPLEPSFSQRDLACRNWNPSAARATSHHSMTPTPLLNRQETVVDLAPIFSGGKGAPQNPLLAWSKSKPNNCSGKTPTYVLRPKASNRPMDLNPKL